MQITTLANGNYVVVWNETDSVSSDVQVFGQIYAPDGTAIDDPFQVETPLVAAFPEVAALADGGFIIAYTWLGNTDSGASC